MEVFNTNEHEFQELGIRVSRMRVSLRMKKKQRAGSSSDTNEPQPQQQQEVMMEGSRVPVGPSSTGSNGSGFRSRLSSSSSTCSTDSGFVSNGPRSRLGSTASTSSSSRAAASRQPGSILTKIAKGEVSKNADAEFSVFYRPRSAVSRSGSNSSSCSSNAYRSHQVRRSGSSVSTASTGSSRNRSISLCSTTNDQDIYSTIEELCDVFEESTASNTAPPPLPPRKARLRPPALPPYPSSAIKILNNITDTILC